jgi:hypothetical protein
MKKTIAILLIAGIVFACNEVRKEVAKSVPGIYNLFCNLPATPDVLCSHLPFDVNENLAHAGYDSFLDSLHQPPFDVFSWQTFVALNWPADASGNPIGTSINGAPEAARVWEHYKDPAEVFGHPTPGLVLALGAAMQTGQKFFYMDSKAPHPLLSGQSVDMRGFKEADGHPLIDRNLNFALYEIKMNPVESSYVIDSSLTTLQGIYSYARFNGNAIHLPASDSLKNNPGSMEIKASWRILIPAMGDDTSRYYCRTATIFIDAAHSRNHKPLIIPNVKVGLVGMHIIRKTKSVSTNEIWTTFEHVDNTPDNAQEAQASNKHWSFYNPNCLNCTPNIPPDTVPGDNGQYIWDTAMPYALKYAVPSPGQSPPGTYGTQAIRVYPVYKYTEMINRLWQEKLKGSVWANYRLIGSQWRQAEVFPEPTAPNFLANTTLETFIQSDASCISCHSFATVTFNNDTIATNLSFLFGTFARDTTRRK